MTENLENEEIYKEENLKPWKRKLHFSPASIFY